MKRPQGLLRCETPLLLLNLSRGASTLPSGVPGPHLCETSSNQNSSLRKAHVSRHRGSVPTSRNWTQRPNRSSSASLRTSGKNRRELWELWELVAAFLLRRSHSPMKVRRRRRVLEARSRGSFSSLLNVQGGYERDVPVDQVSCFRENLRGKSQGSLMDSPNLARFRAYNTTEFPQMRCASCGHEAPAFCRTLLPSILATSWRLDSLGFGATPGQSHKSIYGKP